MERNKGNSNIQFKHTGHMPENAMWHDMGPVNGGASKKTILIFIGIHSEKGLLLIHTLHTRNKARKKPTF